MRDNAVAIRLASGTALRERMKAMVLKARCGSARSVRGDPDAQFLLQRPDLLAYGRRGWPTTSAARAKLPCATIAMILLNCRVSTQDHQGVCI
ncbi:hypothetical protein [Paracoccus spongiarum]|uniref:hypothetical protein n=1 Tax=Paracoccus spongiarum TaxID=3064387 RepID=UPI0035321279